MNRRSFLKSAALAAVAVPVVGLPAMPVAKAALKYKYAVPGRIPEYRVSWSGRAGSGQFTSPVYERASSFMSSLFREDQANHLMSYDQIILSHTDANGNSMVLWLYS